MGVSISRPPRCERGALPAELIARTGSHKFPARAPGYATVGERTASWHPIAPSLAFADYGGTVRIASAANYWLLGVAGSGELGQTTTPGY